MRVSFESKGDFDDIRSWLQQASKAKPDSALRQIGSDGVKALSANTPKDTGATASGWTYEVKSNFNTSEIVWTNRAHPNLRVNLARLLDSGYVTGTGGRVAPRPYIAKSMDKVWKVAGDKIYKELIK